MKKKIGNALVVAGVLLLCGCGNHDPQQKVVNATVQEVESTIETESTGEIVMESSTEEIIVNGNEGTIRIGTSGSPYTELLTQAKRILAEEGWDLQVEVYTDYAQMNQDVLNGTLDAHLFAHQAYLNSYNDVNATDFTPVASICYEIYGVYSKLNPDLTDFASGIKLGIPKDDIRKARSLLFLQDLGYITLKDGVGMTAILDDVVDNQKNIQFVEYTQDTISDVLQTVDYCIMGADQAILAGLEPEKEVLKEETSQSDSAEAMAALLVTTAEKADEEKLRILEAAIKSDVTQEYIEDTFKGALGLFP